MSLRKPCALNVWHVLVMNNNSVFFDDVIRMVHDLTGQPIEFAVNVAMAAHFSGFGLLFMGPVRQARKVYRQAKLTGLPVRILNCVEYADLVHQTLHPRGPDDLEPGRMNRF